MLTQPEVKRWASLMLMSALRGDLQQKELDKHINALRSRHGDEVFEMVLEAMLKEASRIGPGHCDGSCYHKNEVKH